ncbi:ER-derived vesicles protein ERV14 [Zostera marina]|uniref:ER-derived vesicles protein ERV14 n=1 Tax=Zostera marina TaxID=29655 RepID=A0A0K9PW43_ZOSMR|nr:ER-derived vesicles protein ERV14 [Zostera marina]
MALDLILWLFIFFSVIGLIGMNAYQLINLTDLEFDYINLYDSSSRINAIVIPEFVVQGAVCAVFLLTCHWFPFLIMAPITYYHVRLYRKRAHLLDVTEIFSLIPGEKKYRLIKLGFYVSIFLITIYRLVVAAVIALIHEDGPDGVIFESGIY